MDQMSMPTLPESQSITLGCDPEFFFTKDGKVIGSEKVIPEKGLGFERCVIDGVQAELHPNASTCRDVLSREIATCLLTVKGRMGKDIGLDFGQVVEVTQSELDSLADKNKKFGCAASMNTHKMGKNKVTTIKANPLTYLKRSAGGHIHLGAKKIIETSKLAINGMWQFDKNPNPWHEVLQDAEHLVPILDILVGNTAVLLDRHPGNVERRKNYGKAGEYRLPDHGIEYRTLSNFWLRGRPLFYLMFGLARQSVNILYFSTHGSYDYAKKLNEIVDIRKVRKAIDKNDFDLASKNFEIVEGYLTEITRDDRYGHYPLNANNIKEFHRLVDRGLDYFFPQPPIEAWLNPIAGHLGGYYEFSRTILSEDLAAHPTI